MTSPVDFISGDKKTFCLGNLSNGKTGFLTAINPFCLLLTKFISLILFPIVILAAILANGISITLLTKGTVRLALGLTSITNTISFLIAN